MTPYKVAEVRGTSTNEVLDVVRRIISRAEGGRLITEDGKGGRRLVWTGYARATWDCSRVLALEAPAGLIYGALPASKRRSMARGDSGFEVGGESGLHCITASSDSGDPSRVDRRRDPIPRNFDLCESGPFPALGQ